MLLLHDVGPWATLFLSVLIPLAYQVTRLGKISIFIFLCVTYTIYKPLTLDSYVIKVRLSGEKL